MRIGTDGDPVTLCGECGALVYDVETHRRWHALLRRLLETVA